MDYDKIAIIKDVVEKGKRKKQKGRGGKTQQKY